MEEQPILTFDTSAINRLADDPSLDLLIAHVCARFWVQFSFESVEEIVATNDAARRHTLLGVSNRLLAHGGCIDPAGPMVQKMVAQFEGGAWVHWTKVDVGVRGVHEMISHIDDFADCLTKQVLGEKRKNSQSFDEVYREAKPHFDGAWTSQGTNAPCSSAALVDRLPKTFWKVAWNIYAQHAKKPFDETSVQGFMEQCDPFRALVNAFFVAAFDQCVRPLKSATSFRSGSGDTLMSVCLPYCDHFVTNDTKAGGQLAFYREVCSLARLKYVAVQSYDEFRRAFCAL